MYNQRGVYSCRIKSKDIWNKKRKTDKFRDDIRDHLKIILWDRIWIVKGEDVNWI